MCSPYLYNVPMSDSEDTAGSGVVSEDGNNWPTGTRQGTVSAEGAHLCYTLVGHGQQHMVLFHGFGQQANSWLPLVEPFLDRYTFILIDLFYHGSSVWENRNAPLGLQHWSVLMERLCQQNQVSNFIVGGYSIGCKFALATAAVMPTRVLDLILVAPDGLAKRFWYQMATGTTLGMQLFKWMVLKPGFFFAFANLLHNLRLLDESMLRFVANNMNTRRKRLLVYHSWVTFRDLQQPAKQLAQQLNQQGIGLQVFLGKWDKVVRRKHVAPLIGKVKKVSLHTLESNHQNLVKKVSQYFSSQLHAKEQTVMHGQQA